VEERSSVAPACAPGQTEVDLDAPSPQPDPEPAPAPPVPPGSLTIQSNIAARAVVEPVGGGAIQAGIGCTEVNLPLEQCHLQPGTYVVRLRGEDPFIDQSLEVEVGDEPVTKQIDFGLLEAKPGYALARELKNDDAFTRMALPGGRQTVYIVNVKHNRRSKLEVPVHLGQTVIVP
jgi:hypothetical protein